MVGSWCVKENGTIFLLLSFQKSTYLHITYHVGLCKIDRSVFHKALFPTSLRLNLLMYFLDSQTNFKLNSLFSRKKYFARKLLWFKYLPSRIKYLFLLMGKSNYMYFVFFRKKKKDETDSRTYGIYFHRDPLTLTGSTKSDGDHLTQ